MYNTAEKSCKPQTVRFSLFAIFNICHLVRQFWHYFSQFSTIICQKHSKTHFLMPWLPFCVTTKVFTGVRHPDAKDEPHRVNMMFRPYWANRWIGKRAAGGGVAEFWISMTPMTTNLSGRWNVAEKVYKSHQWSSHKAKHCESKRRNRGFLDKKWAQESSC